MNNKKEQQKNNKKDRGRSEIDTMTLFSLGFPELPIASARKQGDMLSKKYLHVLLYRKHRYMKTQTFGRIVQVCF